MTLEPVLLMTHVSVQRGTLVVHALKWVRITIHSDIIVCMNVFVCVCFKL